MIRDGASYSQIRAALGLSPPTISSIRRALDIPRRAQRARTPAEALALYSQPATDGHTHWTGPHSGCGVPQLWADGRSYRTLRVAFHLHHHRHPDGPVRRACDDPHCITGAHLTDRTIRATHHRADQAYERIFERGVSR